MAGKIDPIPENMSVKEASEFWDIHSVADYPSHMVELEYTPGERMTFIAIANDLLTQAAKQARKRGVSVETLVNLWVQEKVAV
jgi:hypothetical protein